MKAVIIKSKSSKPKNPWANVTFPCLVENDDGSLAIATNASEGYVIHDTDTDTPRDDLDDLEDSSWELLHWTPVIGSRTIEFSN